MTVCAQKDKGRAWEKNSPQMNHQRSSIKNKSGLIELFSQMPDCKSPYLTASRLLSQYGRKRIIKICIAFTSTAQNSTELDKNNQSNYYRGKKVPLKDLFKDL